MAGFSDFEDPTMVTGMADHILVWAVWVSSYESKMII